MRGVMMTSRNRARAEGRAEMLGVCLLVAGALVVGYIVGVGRGASEGASVRASELRQAQASAYDEGAQFGNDDGWRECIEENNLYDRYTLSASLNTAE